MITDRFGFGHTATQRFSTAAALGGICFLLALFCLQLIAVSGAIPPLWLPTALMTVIAFRLNWADAALTLLFCFISVMLANTLMTSPAWINVHYALIHLLQAVLGGMLLRLLLNRRAPLETLYDWCKLLLAAGIITPFLGGFLALWLLGGNGSFFATWVIAEIIGMLAIAPVCLLWQPRMLRQQVSRRQLFETLLCIVVSLSACYVALRFLPWPFTFIIVILFTCAVRLPRFAAFVVFLVNAAMISVLLSLQLVVLHIDAVWLSHTALWLPFLLILLPSHMMSLVMHSFRAEKAHISESELRFRHAMEYSTIGMAMVSPEGRWLSVNDALCQLLGYPQAELMQMTFQQLTHPDDISSNVAAMQRILAGEGDSYLMEKRYIRRDGETVWANLSSSLVRNNKGEPLYFISQLQDITELKRTEETNRCLMERVTQANAALFAEKERMHITLDSIGEAVISTNEEMLVTFMNPVAERMSGWSQEEAAGKALSDILHITRGVNGARIENLLLCALPADKTAPEVDEELVLHSAHHEQFDIQYSLTPLKTEEGHHIGTVMVVRDVSESRETLRQLTYSASHDILTRLPNRASFEQQLRQLLQNISGSQQHVLVFIDLDRFKAVNDAAGHAAGDALLCELSTLMLHHLHGNDVIARLGGDEFGVLLPDCTLRSASDLIQRLVNAVNHYAFQWQGNIYQVGASAGMTQIDATNCQSSDVMSQADAACYHAKHNGRGQLQIYQHHHASIVARPASALTAAEVEKMPIRLLSWAVTPPGKTQAVSFYLLEAERLADASWPLDENSWQNALQETALQLAFDRNLMRHFFAHYAQPLASKAITLALPLSATALRDDAFVTELHALLHASPLPPAQLIVVIETAALLADSSRLPQTIAQLKHSGCRIMLQNFGRHLDAFNQFHGAAIDYIMMSPDLVATVHASLMDEMLVSIIHGQAEKRQIITLAGPVELPAALTTLNTIGINGVWGNAIGERQPVHHLVQNSYFAIK